MVERFAPGQWASPDVTAPLERLGPDKATRHQVDTVLHGVVVLESEFEKYWRLRSKVDVFKIDKGIYCPGFAELMEFLGQARLQVLCEATDVDPRLTLGPHSCDSLPGIGVIGPEEAVDAYVDAIPTLKAVDEMTMSREPDGIRYNRYQFWADKLDTTQYPLDTLEAVEQCVRLQTVYAHMRLQQSMAPYLEYREQCHN